MNILAIDTASAYFSVAIISNGQAVDYVVAQEQNRPAEKLLPTIEVLLHKNNLSYHDLESLVTTLGPGSFVGIRIGIATLQGISLITNKPLYGISNLELTAFTQFQNNPTQSNIKAVIRRDADSSYYQTFSLNLMPLTPPAIITSSDLKPDEHTLTNINAKSAGLLALMKINKKRFKEMLIKPVYIQKMC